MKEQRQYCIYEWNEMNIRVQDFLPSSSLWSKNTEVTEDEE